MVYKRLLKPNGLIEQWGLVHTYSGGDAKALFDISYSNINYNVSCIIFGNFGASQETCICSSKNSGECICRCYNSNRDVLWQVKGY